MSLSEIQKKNRRRESGKLVSIGKHKVGEYIWYKTGIFKIESFPDAHTIVASNTSSSSDMPAEIRILISEL